MPTWLQNTVNQAKQNLGGNIALIGGAVSRVVGRDLRIGGGQGIGAGITGSAQPLFSVKNVSASEQPNTPGFDSYFPYSISPSSTGSTFGVTAPTGGGGSPTRPSLRSSNLYPGFSTPSSTSSIP